jgi:hypothetical protein
VHRVTNFLLFDIPTDVGLPCDELQYRAGVSSPVCIPAAVPCPGRKKLTMVVGVFPLPGHPPSCLRGRL